MRVNNKNNNYLLTPKACFSKARFTYLNTGCLSNKRYFSTNKIENLNSLNKNLRLICSSNKTVHLDYKFLEWFSGFSDAECNFNLLLRNFNNNSYYSVMATFQIGLHIDDLPLLEFIQKTLKCGHISVSGTRCNFFINDQYFLINVVPPIFNYVKLNNSKFYKFLIFEKVVNCFKDKSHLTSAAG